MRQTVVVFYDEGAQGQTQLGGGQIARLTLMKNLDGKRFKPILLTSHRGELSEAAVALGVETKIVDIMGSFSRRKRENVLSNPLSLVKVLISVFSGALKLKRILQKLDADILHPNENQSRLVSALMRLFFRIPTVIHIDGEWNRGATDIILKNLFYGSFTHLIAVTNRVKQIAQEKNLFYSEKKTSVIYTGIDISKFEAKPAADIRKEFNIHTKAILFTTVGKIVDFKGHWFVLKAMSMIVQQNENYDFIYLIVGTGPDENSLRKLVDELGLEKYVVFAGQRNDIASILAQVDFLIHPSLTESFGLVIAEALMSGRYVLATGAGGSQELLDLFPTATAKIASANVEDTQEKIMVTFEHLQDRKREASRIREQALATFDIKQTIHEIEKIYCQQLEK